LMLHQPLSGVQGQASDIAIEAVHVVRLRERLYGMIAEVTGQPVGKVTRDFDRNRWMTAKEALAYGLIDEIVTPSPIDLSEYKGRIPMSVRLAGFVTGE
jgi:ATP-dependent Clp protease, protease subunit